MTSSATCVSGTCELRSTPDLLVGRMGGEPRLGYGPAVSLPRRSELLTLAAGVIRVLGSVTRLMPAVSNKH